VFCAHVLAGDININAFDWPVFCYEESKYDPENPKQGLLQGHLLLRVYHHVFSGPSSALQSKTKGWSSRGQKNSRLPAPTPETIGYAAILVRICNIFNHLPNLHEARWALSASPSFGDEDIKFRLDDFYYCILELLDEEAPTHHPNKEFDRSWAEATLTQWRE